MTGRLRPGDQPLPQPADGPSMHDLVITDVRARNALGKCEEAAVIVGLADRKRLGIERYGQPLQADNGRDALRDLAEELMDAAVYCRQVLEEDRLPGGLKASMRITYDALIAMLFRVAEARNAVAEDDSLSGRTTP